MLWRGLALGCMQNVMRKKQGNKYNLPLTTPPHVGMSYCVTAGASTSHDVMGGLKTEPISVKIIKKDLL